jgi:hypothetical protein
MCGIKRNPGLFSIGFVSEFFKAETDGHSSILSLSPRGSLILYEECTSLETAGGRTCKVFVAKGDLETSEVRNVFCIQRLGGRRRARINNCLLRLTDLRSTPTDTLAACRRRRKETDKNGLLSRFKEYYEDTGEGAKHDSSFRNCGTCMERRMVMMTTQAFTLKKHMDRTKRRRKL